jgi:hypothetical protein
MRPALPLLAALIALLLAAAPVAAHHGRGGHDRGPDADGGTKSEHNGGFAACDWQSDPDGCPGNSGWPHWCKLQHGPGQGRGLCIAEHARAHGVEVDRDDDGKWGDLHITDVDVNADGWFRVRGRGASGAVTVWVGGGSGKVVGFGQGGTDQEGRFDIRGQWACQDDGSPRRARVRAQDADERDSETASFPCNEEG